MIRIPYRHAWAIGAAICLLIAVGQPTVAAETPQGQAAERTPAWFNGRTEFMDRCAACHGIDAKGHGPVAALMTVALPDLTALSERHGGAFPYEFVSSAIDGRKKPRAHGSLEMPLWGKHYSEGRTDRVGEIQVNAHIYELLIYLESIQQPTSAGQSQ